MDDSPKWYLAKQQTGEQFGPLPFSKLHQWAIDAYISPLDRISSDGVNWLRAPMIPELHMDFLLETEPGVYYGPTTLGAVRDFLNSGEISLAATLINCQTGEQRNAGDYPELNPPTGFAPAAAPFGAESAGVSARENLQARIRELEEALLQERQLRQAAEAARDEAEADLARLERLIEIDREK